LVYRVEAQLTGPAASNRLWNNKVVVEGTDPATSAQFSGLLAGNTYRVEVKAWDLYSMCLGYHTVTTAPAVLRISRGSVSSASDNCSENCRYIRIDVSGFPGNVRVTCYRQRDDWTFWSVYQSSIRVLSDSWETCPIGPYWRIKVHVEYNRKHENDPVVSAESNVLAAEQSV
jgi:hypothetical protein